jgi:hypothetical protein
MLGETDGKSNPGLFVETRQWANFCLDGIKGLWYFFVLRGRCGFQPPASAAEDLRSAHVYLFV